MTVARDTLNGLMSRLNEARAMVFDLQCLLRLRQGQRPAPAMEVGGIDPNLLRFVASTDFPVLLWGAAGAPGALIARFIHDQSPWAAGPFVSLRAASLKRGDIPGHLAVGEAGGVEGGRRGTLFVDEITHLAPETQEELTAALEEDHQGSRARHLPMRLISSTRRSIEGALESGVLSERLYTLMARILVPVSPAKPERARSTGRSFATSVLAECNRLQGSRDGNLYPYFLRFLQDSLIDVALEKSGWNQLRAARLLGVNRNTLRKWMRLLETTPNG